MEKIGGPGRRSITPPLILRRGVPKAFGRALFYIKDNSILSVGSEMVVKDTLYPTASI